jgi:hypothetical protein
VAGLIILDVQLIAVKTIPPRNAPKPLQSNLHKTEPAQPNPLADPKIIKIALTALPPTLPAHPPRHPAAPPLHVPRFRVPGGQGRAGTVCGDDWRSHHFKYRAA